MMNNVYNKVKEMTPFTGLMSYKEIGMDEAIMKGHEDAEVLFVAIQPSHPNINEEKNKSYNDVVYNSPIGVRFYQPLLKKLNLKYDDIYISNLIKHPHPANAPPTKEMADYYFGILQEQLKCLKKLKYVVLLGNFVRDYVKDNPLNTDAKIISHFHPSYSWRIGKTEEHLNELTMRISSVNADIILMQQEWNNVWCFYRDNSGIKQVEIIELENYFYVLKSNLEIVQETLNEATTNSGTKVEYNILDITKKSIYNEDVIKIIPQNNHYWACLKALKRKYVKTYEGDISQYLKVYLQEHFKFANKRRVGIIDIETNESLDVHNTPEPITSITIYNYNDSKFYIWILETPGQKINVRENNNEILYKFVNERKMLLDFMEKFRNMDFDIIGGWYSNNFDFPYILNRLKLLDIDINLLSKFNKVEYHYFKGRNGRVFYNINIFGLETIDFIPVLQKNTCYSSQPASWSLKSACEFYLEKSKTDGVDLWKKDINKFIDYNVNDVVLVKELIDKFKLADFLIVIQTEMVPVPLEHATHNSIVLLYYLKNRFPDVIIPDNYKKVKLDEDIVDLNDSYIEIKAAKVINAVPGIHENVSIYDFSGLYPSIFRTFNICPSTINNNSGVLIDDIEMRAIDKTKSVKTYNFKKYFFQESVGIYPTVLKELGEKRKLHKGRLREYKEKYGENNIMYLLELYRSDVIKQIVNSLFGVGGFNNFSLFNPWVSAAVTSISRKLITFLEVYVGNQPGFKVLSGDTDSLLFLHPKDLNQEEFIEKLNIEVKKYVLDNLKVSPENYCIELEFQSHFKKFVMKDAKKKYYGIKEDGSFYVKGFALVQHVLSNKVKKMIEILYINFINNVGIEKMRELLNGFKKEFYALTYKDLGQELKLENNPEEYKTNIQHCRAALYSNKYLGTNFRAGSVGKLIFIKKVDKYVHTDMVFLDERTVLPDEFEIDYNKSWDKMIISNVKLLEGIQEMKIPQILNKNKTLGEFT